MKHFLKLAEGLPVVGVLEQLYENPGLWNARPERTRSLDSPHYDIPDIWVRYRASEELTSPEKFNEPHFAGFYPAWQVLPALHPIVFGLMRLVKSTYLGGILITKIPAGKQVRPHDDRGGWHAETMNCKVYVPLQSNPKCINFCMDESVNMQTGEAWTFSNLKTHSVVNDGTEDRITAIICMKTEGA